MKAVRSEKRWWGWAWPYVVAFCAGYVGALVPVLAEGRWPNAHDGVAALAAGILATHLLDRRSPRAGEGAE